MHNKNRFLADPFVIYRNGSHYCFVEDFSYAENKGCISVYEISHDGYQELGVALKKEDLTKDGGGKEDPTTMVREKKTPTGVEWVKWGEVT